MQFMVGSGEIHVAGNQATYIFVMNLEAVGDLSAIEAATVCQGIELGVGTRDHVHQRFVRALLRADPFDHQFSLDASFAYDHRQIDDVGI